MPKEVKFQFERSSSPLFSVVFRPVAQVFFLSKSKIWIPAWGIVDTGADYTLLPKGYATKLGINLNRDCRVYKTSGIGGEEKAYIYENAKIRIGNFEISAPIGFLDRVDVPPLLGRQGFLETFELVFKNHETIFRGM